MLEYLNDPEKQGLAIVTISVANIRRLPVFQSELLNQTLLGTIVAFYEFQNDFYYIQNHDGHWGWINKHSLREITAEEAQQWLQEEKIFITANYATVHQTPDTHSPVLTDLVPTITLPLLRVDEHMAEVRLPDGRSGFVPRSAFRLASEQQQIEATPDNILKFARQFLGIPYLWGGTSSKGFDCSGFVQTVFRMVNVSLPRDSGQMFHVGKQVGSGKEEQGLIPGDLLFFGKSRRRINHVAIYMGEGRYIHARGKVTVNSIRSTDPLFEPYLFDLIVEARRVLEL